MKDLSDETRSHRTIRDLVALSTLPAIWVNHQPLQVAESLADVLLNTFHLDFVYLRLHRETAGYALEVARTGHRPTRSGQAEAIGRALAPWLEHADASSAQSLPNPIGIGTVQVVLIPVGFDGEDGLLVAGSQQAGFPGEEDRLLLGVAVNQAATVLQRQRADRALRLAHARLDLAVRGSNIGIWEIEMPDGVVRNGRVSFTNIFELLGYDRPDLASDSGARMTLVHPDDQSQLEEAIQAYLSGQNEELEVEHRARHKDGSYRWMLTRRVAIRDAADRPVGLIGSSIDITGHKRAEVALRASEKRLAADLAGMARLQEVSTRLVHVSDSTLLLQDIVDAAIAITAADMGNIQLFDPDSGMLKIVASRGLGLSFLEFFKAVHVGQCACGGAAHNGNRVVVVDITASPLFAGTDSLDVLLDSGVRAVQSTPLTGRSGQLVGVLSTHYRAPSRPADRDLSVLDTLARQAADWIERTQAHEALRESEARFRGTFENAAVGIANTDVQGRFLRVNDKLCDIVGYTREELLERSFAQITHPEHLLENLELYARLWRGEVPSFTTEKRYTRKDGSAVWGELTVSLQSDATGAPRYAIAVVEDVSDRKRLEAELRRAKEAAEAANRSKDEFLANVSHEIRTPFGAILGMTELVLDTPLTDDQRQCLETAMSAADSLLGLVDELLDFAKIEAGKLELVPANFSLRMTLADSLRAIRVRASDKGLVLVCEVGTDVPDALVGDAGRLRQVLLNLVGNAIKFTRQGEVSVQVEAVDDSATREAVLLFAVRDTGIGIPPDGQERIFRAFEQADNSTTREYGGTGLGLTISARLVELMGGTIAVKSEPGRGSTFSFTARFGRQPQVVRQVVTPPSVAVHMRRQLRQPYYRFEFW
jgi:PAS domain S-box-containing protein